MKCLTRTVLIFLSVYFVREISAKPFPDDTKEGNFLCQGYLSDCQLSKSGVYVSVSSLAELPDNDIVLRWIEVSWWGIVNSTGDDFVGLWNHNPFTDMSGLIESSSVVGVDGKMVTSIQFDGSEYPEDIPSTSTCLPYWGGYVSNGKVVYASCFRLNTHWMSDIRESLENYRLAEILLPGSHDAGAYGSANGMFITKSVAKWTITQDESLWQQLMLGTRYLDMRLSYYDNTTEKFFVNHGDVRIRPLVPYLKDVSRFLDETNEIVIFDIHGFYHGFDQYDNAKIDLTHLLESYFGDWMVPQSLSPNPLLSELWALDRRIVVTYPESETCSNLIWNNTVDHLYGNVDKLDDLYSFMSTNIPKMSGADYLWSAMTEFTPTAKDVTLNRWNGLRGAANLTNQPVSLWLRREWWTMVNIIAMDFITSSDVINTVVEGNVKRHQCNICLKYHN